MLQLWKAGASSLALSHEGANQNNDRAMDDASTPGRSSASSVGKQVNTKLQQLKEEESDLSDSGESFEEEDSHFQFQFNQFEPGTQKLLKQSDKTDIDLRNVILLDSVDGSVLQQ